MADAANAESQARLAEKLLTLEGEIAGLFDRVPFGSHTESADGTFLSINAMEKAWLGYTSAELIGKRKLFDLLTPHSQEIYRKYRPAQGAAQAITDLHLEIMCRNGSTMPVSLSSMHGHNSTDPLLHGRLMLFDLTESRQQRNRNTISAAVFESPSGTMVTDQHAIIQQVNAAFTSITGYSAAEAIGKSSRLLRSGRHDKTFYVAMWDALKSAGHWEGEIWNRRKNGEPYVEWLSISTVMDITGMVTNYVGSFTDITNERNARDELSHMAYHDYLTQLPNRRLLLDRLSQAISNSRRSHLFNAILYVDLDNFKVINDSSGHEAGDTVLAEVAQRLRHAVREGDSVARLSGDEFAILLEGLDADRMISADRAQGLGEKILTVLSQRYTVGPREFHCTASIGIELFRDEASASDLLQRADMAMYHSKNSGKNTLRFFDSAMQAALTERVGLEYALRDALDRQQFRLYYQPQVNQFKQITGAEVLLRWEHPQRGLVSPAEFIPLAEQTGLIVPIGTWVLKTACAQLKEWERHPTARLLRLAVNVSALQFKQDDFVAQLIEIVRQSDINPKLLKLEITESMLLDVEDTLRKMQELQKIGVLFSMDDFGTGFSSLSVLTRLPIDQLKIDQSFVRNIGIRDTDGVIIQTIIAMAQTLGFEVNAEGVETEVQRDFLLGNQCHAFQGYLSGRPVPLHEFEKMCL